MSGSEDIEPLKVASAIRRWWMQIVTIVGVIGWGYNVDAQVKTNTQRIDKMEAVLVATYVNASIACLHSGALGCVTYREIERGGGPSDAPQLRKENEQ